MAIADSAHSSFHDSILSRSHSDSFATPPCPSRNSERPLSATVSGPLFLLISLDTSFLDLHSHLSLVFLASSSPQLILSLSLSLSCDLLEFGCRIESILADRALRPKQPPPPPPRGSPPQSSHSSWGESSDWGWLRFPRRKRRRRISHGRSSLRRAGRQAGALESGSSFGFSRLLTYISLPPAV